MKKLVTVLVFVILVTLFCSCDSASGDALDKIYSELEENNNYTVTIRSTVQNSTRYTQTVYAFDGDKEYEKTIDGENLYVNKEGKTFIYRKSDEKWEFYATVNQFSLSEFLLYLKPFLTNDNYKYDKRADLYVMLPSVYQNSGLGGIENVWCQFEGDDIIIYYNETINGELIITDMRISEIGETKVSV